MVARAGDRWENSSEILAVELEMLTDGLESERWSVCVLGYRGHLQRRGAPGAMTLGRGVCCLCGLGQRNLFFF